MKTLNFDTGLVTYNLNGVCEITLNPTDKNIVKRLVGLMDALEEKREKCAEAVKTASDKELFDITDKLDAKMRELVDEALGAPVCSAVFGDMSLLAMADGLPVFCNLIFAILDEVDASWAREAKKTNPRIAKYTSKYHK